MKQRPVTVLLKETHRNPAHVRIRVFIGRNPGARGSAGELVLRADEWDEICDEVQTAKYWAMKGRVVNFAADKIETLKLEKGE